MSRTLKDLLQVGKTYKFEVTAKNENWIIVQTEYGQKKGDVAVFAIDNQLLPGVTEGFDFLVSDLAEEIADQIAAGMQPDPDLVRHYYELKEKEKEDGKGE